MPRPQEFVTAEALHQAMNVFWRKGYEATSLVDLLAATGLSKSSLYATFGGKRELFLAAFDEYRRARAHAMYQTLAREPAGRAIEAFFQLLLSGPNAEEPSRGCMSINQAVELAPHDPEVRERVMQDLRLIEEALAQAISRGQQQGDLRSLRPAQDLAGLLMLGFPGLQVLARAGYSPAQLTTSLSLLLDQLEARPGA